MIKYKNILQESAVNELTTEFEGEWQRFIAMLAQEKGHDYADSMLQEIQNIMNSKWFYKPPTPSRDYAILNFNKSYPEYIEYIRKLFGSSVELYRGIQQDNIGALLLPDSQIRKMISGAQLKIQSYQGAHLFSWIQDRKVAENFATELPYTILKATIPVDKIEWAGIAVANVEDRFSYTDKIHNYEFIINHKEGIDAVAESHVLEYGQDKYGIYAIFENSAANKKAYFLHNPNDYFMPVTWVQIGKKSLAKNAYEVDGEYYYKMGPQTYYFITEYTDEYVEEQEDDD